MSGVFPRGCVLSGIWPAAILMLGGGRGNRERGGDGERALTEKNLTTGDR
jgi:hypothetical protein